MAILATLTRRFLQHTPGKNPTD